MRAATLCPTFFRSDNVASSLAPIERKVKCSPLTIRSVREQNLRDGIRWSTPLDDMLTDAESAVLEDFCECERLLRGCARTTDYTGDRVRLRREDYAMLPMGSYPRLKVHHMRRQALPDLDLAVLLQCCLQQWGDDEAQTEAQLGLQLDPETRDARQTWLDAVAAAVRLIAGIDGARYLRGIPKGWRHR